jgi:aquaporin NIP
VKARKYAAEAIGTFFLVFAGTGAIVVDGFSGGKVGSVGVSLVFGLIVLAMVYAVGHISGAHLNPAVTVGFWSTGRHPASDVLPYAGAQIAGALAASGALRLMFPLDRTGLGATIPAGSVMQSFAMEFVLTALLMFVIMGVATDDRAEGTMAGIAIGATIALEALFGGPISGASMNPARSFAPALVSGRLAQNWIYWAAPLLGSLAGGRRYGLIRGGSRPPEF